MRRWVIWLLLLCAVFQSAAFAKPKRKEFNNTTKEVFDAALRTAREKHVVTYVDEPHLMFTFETGTSALSYGFIANASIEQVGASKSALIINVQHKNSGNNASFSFNAGDRMADKFFGQVGEELSRTPTQKVADKPEAAHVEVPANSAISGSGQAQQPGVINVSSNPDGADISVDGAFVGNAPAALKLSAGKHTIAVAQNGYAPWSREVTVTEGSSVNLRATLVQQ